jgi:hypothetical protein
MKTLAFLLCLPLLAASEVLIVADEMPAMQVLAARLEAGAGARCTLVRQTEIPASLERFSALIVYIHGRIGEPAEKTFIDYANSGGKLVLLHHSISSGKRPNQFWFPFLGISLPEGDVAQGGYKYYEGIVMDMVNLAPKHFITTNKVRYPSTTSFKGSDLPCFELDDTEVYLNHVFSGERTILLGVKFKEPKSGALYMQDTGGWYRPAGKGWVFYFMAGHSVHEFENSSYSQIVVNAISFKP